MSSRLGRMYDVSKRASLPMERNRARRPRRKQEEKLCQLSKNSGSTATTTIQSDPNFSLTCFLLLSALLVFLQYTSKETLFLLAITMGVLKNLTLSLALASTAFGFAPKISPGHQIGVLKAAESEVLFGDLDGSDVRVGIIRTRWNDEHVSNLVAGCKKALKECNVKEENIFETDVPGSYELPLAARFLALSGTVDAIVCAGVLIKGETLHFEYISETVASGIMSVQLQTNLPIVYGVLNCLNEDQVKARSSGDNNHGYDWGKTAVEMGLLRMEALNIKASSTDKLGAMGFSKATPLEKKAAPGFF